MRAGWRLVVMAFVTGLSLPPAMAHAQEAEQTTNAPATDAIGPRELENFNLRGTVTRPADSAVTSSAPEAEPEARRTPPRAAQNNARTEQALNEPVGRARTVERSPATASADDRPEAPLAASSRPSARPSQASITVALPPARAASAAVEFPIEDPAAASALAPEEGLSLWPWLLAAIALGAGGAFLIWRRTGREAFAGPPVSAFVAPAPSPPRARTEPAPAGPRPQPGPRPVQPPSVAPPPPAIEPPVGIVATRLRSWLDVEFEPDRCIIEDERVVFEFELDVYNSGSTPATDVRVAIQMFNAAPDQEGELAAFFAAPGEGANRAPDIAPYKRFELRPQLVIPRERLRVLEAGGRRFFVPLIAISIRYNSGKTEGQSAAGFLIGRDNSGEKLAPFRVDLGPRIYRGLGARILPGNIRS